MYSYCPNCGVKLKERMEEFMCEHCGKSFYANSRPTATVIPLYDNKLLVGVRAFEPMKGKFDFLGGFLHNGEHSLDGAIREFKEETGLTINKKNLEYLDMWIDEYEFQDEMIYTFNMIYVLPLDQMIEPKPQDDVADFAWISLNDEDVDIAFESQKEIFRAIKKKYLT